MRRTGKRYSRVLSGTGYNSGGDSSQISPEDIRQLIEDAQKALGWSDLALSRKAGISIKQLLSVKRNSGRSRLDRSSEHEMDYHPISILQYKRVRADALNKVIVALEKGL